MAKHSAGGAENRLHMLWSESTTIRRVSGPGTSIGRFLRKTRLDEIPQLWCVLKGDMAFVGPRPERPEFVDVLAQQIPYYRQRLAVKPGITGWAQINHKYGDTAEDAMVKLEYDLYYLRHMGPLLDLKIAGRTISIVLGLRGV